MKSVIGMPRVTGRLGVWRGQTRLAALVMALVGLYSFAGAVYYPRAAGVPVMDGAFTSPTEWSLAGKVRDDLNVGWFYNEFTQNWNSSNSLTFFKMHAFEDPGYGQLDTYDLNSFTFTLGATTVSTWVFEPGDSPAALDPLWLGEVGLGSYSSLLDDGGFLVRLNDDPTTDRLWTTGMPKPGDPGWNFANYYGVFAYAGFNNSAFTQGYGNISEPRELYEWSITLNTQVGGIMGVPAGPDNPTPPGICNPIWEHITRIYVKDWKPSMGGQGIPGGPGWRPTDQWVQHGFDLSTHPIEVIPLDNGAIPEPSTYASAAMGMIAWILYSRGRQRRSAAARVALYMARSS